MKNIFIAGGGAAGLFLAGILAQKGMKVTIADKGSAPGRKVLAAGGGKCNFTNRSVTAEHYISANPHFCKSALAGYKPEEFIALVEKNGIAYHERQHGQLFCDNSSKDILNMLLRQCKDLHILADEEVREAAKIKASFHVTTDRGVYMADALVVATGGLSLPASGVSPIAYKIAESFGIDVIPPRAGLVPLTLDKTELEHTKALSGISLPATLSVGGKSFTEQLLFTHRGISGPVTLQISNFWKAGDTVTADLLPGFDVTEFLKENHGNKQLKTVLSYKLPARLVEVLVSMGKLIDKPVSKLSTAEKEAVEELLHAWKLKPSGTEGYKTAEVTLGGVDTAALSSKTMEAKAVPGLYFIGETVDVTGILGGYNLQWCWSSAVACAKGITSPQTQPL